MADHLAFKLKPEQTRCKFCGAADVQWRYQLQGLTRQPPALEVWSMCDVCHRYLRYWLQGFQR